MRPESRHSRLALAALCAAVLAPAHGHAQDTTAAVETATVAEVITAAEPYYGYDGVRLSGGSGLTYTLGARTLGDDGLAAGGSLAGMWAPGWVSQRTDDVKLDGGLLRETFNITKAYKGFEAWASIGGTQSWRVTEQTEKLSNLGDLAVGVKYSFTLAPAWSLAPYAHLRMLSPVQTPDGEKQGKYTDTLSPEFGLAVGWYGWNSSRRIPLALTMNLSYDYDRTLNLLTEETRTLVPATPFERLNWGMSDFPLVHTRLGMEWLTRTGCVWSAELLGDLPLITDDTSLDQGRYRGVVAWRRTLARDWLLLHAFVSGSAPVDSDIEVEQLPPYEMGLQLSVALGGFKHGRPDALRAVDDTAALDATLPVAAPPATTATVDTTAAVTDATAPIDLSVPVEAAPAAPTEAATSATPPVPVGETAAPASTPATPARPPVAPAEPAPASPGANDYEQPIENDADIYQ